MRTKHATCGRAATMARGTLAVTRGALRVAGGAVVVTGLVACGTPAGTPSPAERFTAAVESAGRDREALAMTGVTDVDWDRGVMVCPYDPLDAIESILDARWPDAPSTADDGAAYVVFADRDAVVDSIRLDRSAIDPCSGSSLLSSRTFDAATGTLRVTEAASGTGWTVGPNG